MNELKLYVGEGTRTGYIEVRPDEKTWLDFVSNMIGDAEATEILIEGLFRKTKFENYLSVVQLLVKKLRRGGEIHILEDDIRILNHAFYRGDLNLEGYNKLVFGETCDNRSVVVSEYIKEMLEQLGMKITQFKRFNQTVCIKCQRLQ